MSDPQHNLAVLMAAIEPKAGSIRVLSRINQHFKNVDELIQALPIDNKDQLCNTIRSVYAELTTSVGEVYATL